MATVSIPQEPLPFPFKMENGKKITYVDPFLEDTFVVNTSVFMCDDPTQFQIEMRRCFSSIRIFSDEEIEVFRSGKKIDDYSELEPKTSYILIYPASDILSGIVRSNRVDKFYLLYDALQFNQVNYIIFLEFFRTLFMFND